MIHRVAADGASRRRKEHRARRVGRNERIERHVDRFREKEWQRLRQRLLNAIGPLVQEDAKSGIEY